MGKRDCCTRMKPSICIKSWVSKYIPVTPVLQGVSCLFTPECASVSVRGYLKGISGSVINQDICWSLGFYTQVLSPSHMCIHHMHATYYYKY